MKVNVVDRNANVIEDMELTVKEPVVNNEGVILNRVVRAMLLNKRQGTVSTKTRGEVSGGGKKPWRQKGTGRARAGSIRSPLWVGGGVIFGPKPKDFNVKINKKEKNKAFYIALYQRLKENGMIVVDNLTFEKPKTKDAKAFLGNIGVDKCLVILDNNMANAALSFRNIKNVEIKNVSTINTYDILKFKKFVLTKDVLEKLMRRIVNE